MKLKAVIPTRLALDPQRLMRGIQNGLDASARAVKVDFGVTTQTWKKKPEFTITETDDGRIVGTDDEIYGYVNDGTPAHDITPKRGKILVFPWGGKGSYRPKTSVRTIGSTDGGSSGGIVKLKRVKHPGTDAREFDAVIAEKWREQFPQTMQRALDSEVD